MPVRATDVAPSRKGAASLGGQEARVIAEFCKHYGLTFRQSGLLKLALTHRSYLHVTGQGPRESNERLEFLGDSVLGLVTSENLYRAHPNEHEGQLTKTKSLLVSKAILSRRALAMGLGRFVFMSHSEVESGGRQRLSILADAFESVVGAVYLDQGFEAARAFIERWLLADTRLIVADKRHTNYKSHLQEYVQSTFRTHPVYRIRSEMGPDHSKQFMVEVIVGRRSLGEGKGPNKKEAEQAAARNALERVEASPVSDREMRRAERSVTPRPSHAPAEPTEAPAAPGFVDPAEEDEDARGRPRRRGRRGGRGRRAQAEGLPVPAERQPAAEKTERRPAAVLPVTSSSAPAPAPAPVPAPAAVFEVEPRPQAYEEDENEEVGRPEGPREEAHIDPYAWNAPSEEDRGGAPEPAIAPEAAALQDDSAPVLNDAAMDEAESQDTEQDEPSDPSDPGMFGAPEAPVTESAQAGLESPPAFGRRPGRGRRRR